VLIQRKRHHVFQVLLYTIMGWTLHWNRHRPLGYDFLWP